MHSLPAVVVAPGGDPRDSEQPGLAGRDGAFRQTPPPYAQRSVEHRFRQVAIGYVATA